MGETLGDELIAERFSIAVEASELAAIDIAVAQARAPDLKRAGIDHLLKAALGAAGELGFLGALGRKSSGVLMPVTLIFSPSM